MYKRICQGVNDPGTLFSATTAFTNDSFNFDLDWYESLYLYNQAQLEEFEKTGTVAGITDVVTNQLYWDFDSKNDLNKAKADTLKLVNRLNDLDIISEITFSGSKGFGVRVKLKQTISVAQFKHAVFKLAEDLETFDRVINNPSRIIRIVGTKHQVSGLYKTQISQEELTLSIDEIKSISSSSLNETWDNFPADLPNSLVLVEQPKIPKPLETSTLDYSNKPKFLSNCRWSLQNGFFKDGQRSTALLCLAATYKNQGFAQDMVYRMLKGVAEIQSNRTGEDRFPDTELYNNIILQVFSDTWKNGQYSCREQGNFLFDYCRSLGAKKCDHVHDDALKPKTLLDVNGGFKDFVKNIDKNTIVTGIKAIDENFFLCTGSNVGFLGAPGSGKTALGLEILENTSKNGVKSVFASLDMHRNRLFEKVMYRISGLGREELYHKFQMDQEGPLLQKLKEKYENVYFLQKSCPTVQDVRDYVLACQEQSGEKVKLVMIDYFERITSDMSDDTASSKRIAGELQDLVNDLDVCLITIVQPNKASIHSGPDAPLYSYSSIKGSAFVSQAFRQILSIWRPFATPTLQENDHYMQLAILKNDLGEQGEFVFGWNGKRGEITELEDHEQVEFEQLLAKKQRETKETEF